MSPRVTHANTIPPCLACYMMTGDMNSCPYICTEISCFLLCSIYPLLITNTSLLLHMEEIHRWDFFFLSWRSTGSSWKCQGKYTTVACTGKRAGPTPCRERYVKTHRMSQCPGFAVCLLGLHGNWGYSVDAWESHMELELSEYRWYLLIVSKTPSLT